MKSHLLGVLILCAFIAGQTRAVDVTLKPLPRQTSAKVLPEATSCQAPDPRAKLLAEWITARFTHTNFATPTLATKNDEPDMAARMRSDDGPDVQVTVRRSGILSRVAGKKLARGIGADNRTLSGRQATVRNYLKRHRYAFKLQDPETELMLIREETDELGWKHQRFAQRSGGLPVWPCEVTSHFDSQGNLRRLGGTFTSSPSGVSRAARLDTEAAIRIAETDSSGHLDLQGGTPELVVYNPLESPPRLAWKLVTTNGTLEAWRYIVDAVDGRVLNKVTLVQSEAVTGAGIDALGMERPLNVWHSGGLYYLTDTSKPMFDPSSSPPAYTSTRGAITIMDSRNTPATSNPQDYGTPYPIASSNPNGGWIPDAVSAAYALSRSYDYYLQRHSRDSWDGDGSKMLAVVRIGINYNNAYWNSGLRFFGFGDGLSRSLDVCAHEMTHAVISSIGDGGILDYQNESGALNEAFADIFGECVEAQTKGAHDWLIGSDLQAPIRSMANPRQYGQPSSMSEYQNLPNTPSTDYGGVHINSGIISRCFYLIAEGMTNSVGLSAAERIAYRALTVYLTKQSQFIDARHAFFDAAEDLFGIGSTQARAVSIAFDRVEIFDAPANAPPGRIPAVQAPDSTLALRYDWWNEAYYVVRKETLFGDPATGKVVDTSKYLAEKRLVVSGDGAYALAVTHDNDLVGFQTDGWDVTTMGYPDSVYSIGVSKDGRYAAVVWLDWLNQPEDTICVIDIQGGGSRTYELYATASEGNRLNIVQHADVISFTADGNFIVFDAFCEGVTGTGDLLWGWTILVLDRASGTIHTLLNVDSRYDFGNPQLGQTKENLITFDVMDSALDRTIVVAADLFTGNLAEIATVYGIQGRPCYDGADKSIVYSRQDYLTDTGTSLYKQPVDASGITPISSASLLLGDANFAAIYRRGFYQGENAAPAIDLVTPQDGETYIAPPAVIIEATSADPDGFISKVEFYDGSNKLGEDLSAPFQCTWNAPKQGTHRIIARAFDNLGNSAQSPPASITVLPQCAYTLSTTSKLFGAAGGAGSVQVITAGHCPWTITTTNVWIEFTSTTVGSSTGSVSFVVAANPGAARVGYIKVGNRQIAISQSAPDLTKPAVAIASPLNGSRITNATVTVSGRSADNIGVDAVEICVQNSGGRTPYFPAVGTTLWSAPLTDLAAGTNLIFVRAKDLSGNYSAEKKLTIVHPVFSPVVIVPEGFGTVSPNYTGQLLEIGKRYKVTARPGSGWVFSNWSGIAAIESTNLSFVMSSNLVLKAHFIPNPFLPLKGSYSGLFYSPEFFLHESSGFMKLQLASSGSFTGSARLAGKTNAFSGKFNLRGEATNILSKLSSSPVILEMHLDLTSGADGLFGLVKSGSWLSDLVARRAATIPTALAGSYTLVIPGDDDGIIPEIGYGYAQVTLSTGGLAKLNGRAADGTAILYSASISQNGLLPVYLSMYKGRGSLVGWVDFGSNNSNYDIESSMVWTHPQDPASSVFSEGFVLQSTAIGARYFPPVTKNVPVLAASSAIVEFWGGKLASPFTNAIAISVNNRVTNLSPNKLVMGFQPSSGVVTGSVTVPISGQVLQFKGAVLQNSDTAVGYFLNSGESGCFRLKCE